MIKTDTYDFAKPGVGAILVERGRIGSQASGYLATGAGKKGVLVGPGTGKAVAGLITEGSTKLPAAPWTSGGSQWPDMGRASGVPVTY